MHRTYRFYKRRASISWLRGVVLGLDDGVVTTLVTVMTISSIAGSHLFRTMIGVVLASAISMALGGYAAARAAHDAKPIQAGLQTGGAFIVGGIAPLLPVALNLTYPQIWAYIATVLVSLLFGWLKSRYAGGKTHWSLVAMGFLGLVTIGTVAGILIGWLLP